MGAFPSLHQSSSHNSPERTFRKMDTNVQMPSHAEVEARFHNVLASMDLPPDKIRLLKSYDDKKKWELLCDKEKVSAKEPPENYLNKLKLYLGPSSHKNSKALRKLGDLTSTQILRNLEISLRTNPIGWVRLFLGEEHNGLDVLVEYLSMTQENMRLEQISQSRGLERMTWQAGTTSSLPDRKSLTPSQRRKLFDSKAFSRDSLTTSTRSSMRTSFFSIRPNKHNIGFATDDVHVCIMCLRAIMNHQYGFNLVFAHEEAINCITLSLNHHNYRTKTLVLELLAAVCLVSGGHQMILKAFDNFKTVCGENNRFETLMKYFKDQDHFHIDFMVACMQFINIVVHSVEDMNFRVHLQHEFSLLGLDHYLQHKLRDCESERLPIQVNAYLDNTIDVQMLLDESEMKTLLLEKVSELEEELSHTLDSLHDQEEESSALINELRSKNEEVKKEAEDLKILVEQQITEINNLKNSRQKEVSISSSSSSSSSGISLKQSSDHLPPSPTTTTTTAPIPQPPAPPAPPPCNIPPPPPLVIGAPPPPPIFAPLSVAIKKPIQPMNRLPVFNWTAMKPNEVKGTMFNDLDDERLYKVINFHEFENLFKLDNNFLVDVDGPLSNGHHNKHTKKKPEKSTLLDSNRLRNVAIIKRKIEMKDDEVVKAINSMDLKRLPLDRVEVLMKMIPNDQEVKAFKDFDKDKKDLDLLTEEDRFVYALTKVERLQAKLSIMSFIGNFYDTLHHLQPQLQAVSIASNSIRESKKLKRLFEVILAFGNYMNSCKRGAVYGFRPQSLDMLTETKSNDKKLSLLMFIVKTINSNFADLATFDSEIKQLEKASTVSIENIMVDIKELERGMEMTKKECNHRKDAPTIIKDFVSNSEDKIKKLKSDSKHAQDAYNRVIEYFGENSKTLSPNAFFSIFLRFIKAYKQAETELESMARLEEAQKTIMASVKENKSKKESAKIIQESIMGELKQKQRIREKKLLNREEVCHGTLEDILLDLKSEPYRRADAVRRSQRTGKDMASFYANNNLLPPV